MYWIYFIKSLKNGKVYVGHTDKEPIDRLEEHNVGCNEWTRSNGPFALIYFESYFCKKDAIHRELFYKSGFGRRIKKIIIDQIEKTNK